MAEHRILAIAVAARRVGYVFFIDGHLKDWRVNERSAVSPIEAVELCQTWINHLKPNIVVTERIANTMKKSEKTKLIIKALSSTASQNYVLDVAVDRDQPHGKKYEEAQVFMELYPDIKPWLPQARKFYEDEPRNTVLVDALVLAHKVISRPTTTLAAAM